MQSKLEKLCAARGLTATCVYGAEATTDWQRECDGWTVTLRYQRRRMTTTFWKGSGHKGAEPTAAEVLGCLLSDADGTRYESFEGWAEERGYDPDSRKALAIYKACEATDKRLEKFLGVDRPRFERAAAEG